MNDLSLLSETRMAKISPYFPKPHGVQRVDDRKVISGIVYVLKTGWQWKHAPKTYVWSSQNSLQPFPSLDRDGRIRPYVQRPGSAGRLPDTLMIDATHLKAHRTAASLLKGGCFRAI